MKLLITGACGHIGSYITENIHSGKSILVDSRNNPPDIEENSMDFLFTSPPYPNEKDYTRTTRLESVLLDFFTDRKELYLLKKGLICSNTRGIHTDDDDGNHIMHIKYTLGAVRGLLSL